MFNYDDKNTHMEIKYTSHLQWRLNMRSIPYHLPRHVWETSNEHYKDTLTHHHIAVQRIKYGGKSREVAVSYDRKEDLIEIITIHPIKFRQKRSRIQSRRYFERSQYFRSNHRSSFRIYCESRNAERLSGFRGFGSGRKANAQL